MSEGKTTGAGFALFGLFVGLAAGASVYALVEYWVEPAGDAPLPFATLVAVGVFGAALLLLAERGATVRAVLPAALIALVFAAPSWYLLNEIGSNEVRANGPDPFPIIFWFVLGAPVSGFVLLTLTKASLLDRVPPSYDKVFFHGLTLPLIGKGAAVLAALALALLFAWSFLMRQFEIEFFHSLFSKPWFILPFLGGVGGLSIAMMRSFEGVLSGLRFLLLLFARIAMPITAVFSITLAAALFTKGPEALFAEWSPGAIMLGLALAGMLIFNGVYQNGQGEPPAAWLRIATAISLLTFPIYAGFAFWAFWVRVGEYGLTPERVVALAVSGLAALYSVVCLAGLLTELTFSGKRWMPLVAPLNTLMAAIWIAVLIALASPIANPWKLGADDQERRLLEGRVDAEKFDYGYLRFRLGEYGKESLQRLAVIENHPQASQIRVAASRALAATDEWEYRNPPAPATPAPADDGVPGIESLPLNPNSDEVDLDAAGPSP
jgi:hypothetical protein